jgi:hypothetical protein
MTSRKNTTYITYHHGHTSTKEEGLQSEFDFMLYITPEGEHICGGSGGGGGGEGEGPSNDRPTLSTNTIESVQRSDEKERSRSHTRYPALAALGLDVGRRRAHKGTHGDTLVPRLQVREAARAALLMYVSLLLLYERERTGTYDGGGVDRAPVVVAVVAVIAAEAAGEGAESGREKHL